jgi:hypothetical protein
MSMTEDVNRSTIRRLAAALQQWDLDEYEVVLAEDAVEGRPQTGERFVGRTNIIGMYRHFPDTPRIAWRRIIGGDNTWALEGTMVVGEGEPISLIGTFELNDGEVIRGDFYFATPTTPPVYHEGWSEPGAT